MAQRLQADPTMPVRTQEEKAFFRARYGDYKVRRRLPSDLLADKINFTAMAKGWNRHYKAVVAGTPASAEFRPKTAKMLLVYYKGEFLAAANATVTMYPYRAAHRAAGELLRDHGDDAVGGPQPPPQPHPAPPLRPPAAAAAAAAAAPTPTLPVAAAGGRAPPPRGATAGPAGAAPGAGARAGVWATAGAAASAAAAPPLAFPNNLVLVPRATHPGASQFAQAQMAQAVAIAAQMGPGAGIAHLLQTGPLGAATLGTGDGAGGSGVGGGGGEAEAAWGGHRCHVCGHLKGGHWAAFHTNALRGRKRKKGGGGGGGESEEGKAEGEGEGGTEVPRCSVRIPEGVVVPAAPRGKRGKGKCYHPQCAVCPDHLCGDGACTRCSARAQG